MTKQIPLKGGVGDVSVSPDGSRIVVASKGEVTVLDGRSGEVVGRVTGMMKPSVVLIGR